jgi:hypothetical protein
MGQPNESSSTNAACLRRQSLSRRTCIGTEVSRLIRCRRQIWPLAEHDAEDVADASDDSGDHPGDQQQHYLFFGIGHTRGGANCGDATSYDIHDAP